MTGIDELRRTLEVHARSVHDDAVPGRADAARTRARQVRRQRTVGIASVTVVAVLAAVALSFWPTQDRPVPADRVLNGHEAPATLKSLGYTYRFARGVEGTDEHAARIGLGAAAGPRLVTWAADGESVRVTGTDGRVLGTEATEFADFVVLPAQSDGAYRVRGENAALAVYELTDQAPPGVTVDGITFRDRVASQRLVAADIGKPGDRELTFDFEVPAGYLTGSVLCTGGGPGTRVNLAFGDQGGVSSSGCQESTFDPGGQGGFGFTSGVGTPPGRTTSVRVWVTSDPGADIPEEVRLGVGLYVADPPAADFPAFGGIPDRQEYAGHTWRFVGLAAARQGSRELDVQAPAGTLVYFYSARLGRGTVHTVLDGESAGLSSVGGGSGVVADPSQRDATYGVTVTGDMNPRGRLALANYVRID